MHHAVALIYLFWEMLLYHYIPQEAIKFKFLINGENKKWSILYDIDIYAIPYHNSFITQLLAL